MNNNWRGCAVLFKWGHVVHSMTRLPTRLHQIIRTSLYFTWRSIQDIDAGQQETIKIHLHLPWRTMVNIMSNNNARYSVIKIKTVLFFRFIYFNNNTQAGLYLDLETETRATRETLVKRNFRHIPVCEKERSVTRRD